MFRPPLACPDVFVVPGQGPSRRQIGSSAGIPVCGVDPAAAHPAPTGALVPSLCSLPGLPGPHQPHRPQTVGTRAAQVPEHHPSTGGVRLLRGLASGGGTGCGRFTLPDQHTGSQSLFPPGAPGTPLATQAPEGGNPRGAGPPKPSATRRGWPPQRLSLRGRGRPRTFANRRSVCPRRAFAPRPAGR
jgi:hypothetical protein